MRSLKFLAGILTLIHAPVLIAQDQSKPAKPKYEFRREHDPNGIGKFYQGREIAQVMGHEGAGWLERKERDQEEQPAKLLPLLKLKAGEIVADIGAGSGYYTFKLADLVGTTGKVYAVDIQPEMLALIRKKMKEKKVEHVVPHMGKVSDPKLPDAAIDLILMVDVYHEFSHPYEMTSAMIKSLKPGGRLVFVEFRMEDENVPIKLVHKMTEKQVLKEMAVFPQMKHASTKSDLPWQHVITFEKKREER